MATPHAATLGDGPDFRVLDGPLDCHAVMARGFTRETLHKARTLARDIRRNLYLPPRQGGNPQGGD